MERSVTSMENFEARYRTRSGLTFGVYNARGGTIQAFVSSSPSIATAATFPVSGLPALRAVFADAKVKLDAAKRSVPH